MSSDRKFSAKTEICLTKLHSVETKVWLPSPKLYLWLVPTKDRKFFQAYVFYLFQLLLRGMRQKGMHPKSFNLMYRAIGRNWSEHTLLGYLQKEFIARNLSLSLLLEPLDGFEWLAKNRYPLEFSAASPIWLQVISPFSRFIAVLNNQTPPFYQPFSALAFVYTATYILAVPSFATALAKARISVDKYSLHRSLPLLQEETLQLYTASSGFLFRLKIGFFIGLSRGLVQMLREDWNLENASETFSFSVVSSKNHQNSVSAGTSTVSFSDGSPRPHTRQPSVTSAFIPRRKIIFFVYVNAFLYGLWHTLVTKNKTRGFQKL